LHERDIQLGAQEEGKTRRHTPGDDRRQPSAHFHRELALYGNFFRVIRPRAGENPVLCVLALGRVWPELAAERLKSALDCQRQDEQASKGTPLAIDAVGASGVPMQPPGRQEGRRRDPKRKDGVPQLPIFPRLHDVKFPDGCLDCRRAGLASG